MPSCFSTCLGGTHGGEDEKLVVKRREEKRAALALKTRTFANSKVVGLFVELVAKDCDVVFKQENCRTRSLSTPHSLRLCRLGETNLSIIYVSLAKPLI